MTNFLITGANGGLATPLLNKLLARGDKVAATVRKPESLSALTEKYPEQLLVLSLDLTDSEAIRLTVARAIEAFGKIDVLINNAGYGIFGALEEISDVQMEHIFQTNFFGSLRMAQAILPHFREQSAGRIIQISSLVGSISNPGQGIYSASKWAVEGAFETLAKEVAPFNIAVNLVEPGGIRTGFFAGHASFGEELSAYDNQAARNWKKAWLDAQQEENPEDLSVGDPEKMAAEIIRLVDEKVATLRLPLGSDTYELTLSALTEKLEQLKTMKERAYSTDAE
ncbi:MAG: SDR family oxidoreductase [Streptococcaceae bacterium]|nr:SDR family oxidoreductase [Streptococcaceae bacterium]